MTFLQQLAGTILQHSDMPLKDTLIVLPNKRARRMLQQELAAGISQPCFSPTIFSIDEFIHKLSDYTLCDDIELLHILFQAYQQFDHAKSEKLASFLSWAETFIHDVSEIDMQLADASRIFGNLSDIKELETVFGRETLSPNQQRYLKFYSSLHELYQSFNSFLDEAKLAYEGKIYKDVAEHLLDYAPKYKFKRFIFAGFQTLSPSEMAIAQYYHQEHQAEFYFDIDDFYRSNYTPFISILQNKLKIKDLNWIHHDYATIPKEIFLVGASKSMNQIFYAIEQLNRIEKEEGSLNNTVLVFADEKLLIPFIHCYDCSKANLTMGYPLVATPAYALLSILLETARNSRRFQNMQAGEFLYYHRDVFSFFRNQLIASYLFPDKQTQTQFLHDLTELNSIFFPLKTLEFNGYGFPDLSGNNPIEVLESISLFFKQLSDIVAEDSSNIFDNYCLELIIDNLNKATHNISEFDTQLTDLDSSIFILNNLLQRISIPLKGSPSEGLQIMGLLETRTLDFKNIIMLSVNEGTLPAGRSSNSLILHEVKRYFDLPTYQEKDTVYGYHFFRLLQRAEQVHLLYNTDSSTSLAEKSRFLKQLDFEIKAQKISNITIHERILPSSVNTEKTSHSISIKKDEACLKKLREKKYAYTHLHDYLSCPLQFYLKHIAHIEAADDISESVEQKLIGDAVHSILEQVGQQLIEQPNAYRQLIMKNINDIDSLVEKHVRKSILEEHETTDQRKIYIDLKHGKTYLATEVVKRAIKSYLFSLLDNLQKAEDNKQTFKLIATEKMLSATLNIDQYQIHLKGFADRIDYRNGHVTILDYKTGYVNEEELKYEQFEDIFSGTEHKQLLQLLMYAYLYDKGQVGGGRWEVEEDLSQGSESEIQSSKFKIQNSSEPETVNYQLSTGTCHLSPDTCNLKPETYNYACGIISFQHLYQKKPHELYPSFQGTGDRGQGTEITPEILQLFEDQLINLLRDIINPELPFSQTDDMSHCRYCDYAAICKKQNTQDE